MWHLFTIHTEVSRIEVIDAIYYFKTTYHQFWDVMELDMITLRFAIAFIITELLGE